MDAKVKLEHSLLAVESEHEVHAMVEIAAPDAAGDAERPPLRIALVLDRSGSMAGPKLAVAKRCAAWLVSRLRPADELALVAYDDTVRLLSALAPVQAARLHGALSRIGPGGQTNLSGGWLKGFEQLRTASADAPRKVILLTDGLANVGIVQHEPLVALARGAAAGGVGTTTIGFGHDFDEELLTAMADAGGGNAHYAETPDEAPAIFAQELEGLASVVAQNVSLEIRPRQPVELVEVLNDYPHVAVPGGVQLQLGDAYGGDRRRVVLKLRVPNVAELGAVPVADLVLRYASVGDGVALHEVTVPVVVNLVSADEAAAAEPDAQVREEVLVLTAARARDAAMRLADAGDYEAAQLELLEASSALRASGLDAEADELAAAAPSVARGSYSPAGRKRLHYDATARRRRRRA